MRPHLSYRANWGHQPGTPDRWVLSLSDVSSETGVTVELVVDRSWNGESWNSYRAFAISDIGETRELLSMDEFARLCDSYVENEGDSPDEEWLSRYSVEGRLLATAERLRVHWEAMVDQLELFSPAITL